MHFYKLDSKTMEGVQEKIASIKANSKNKTTA